MGKRRRGSSKTHKRVRRRRLRNEKEAKERARGKPSAYPRSRPIPAVGVQGLPSWEGESDEKE